MRKQETTGIAPVVSVELIYGRYARHNGSLRNTEAVHTIHLQFTIYHGHGITAHFCGARLMPEVAKPVAKKPLQLHRTN